MANEKKDSYYSALTGFRRAVPIILWALAVFIALCFVTQGTGALGGLISKLLLGLFAGGAYIIPVLIALHALFYPSDVAAKRTLSRILFSTVLLISVSAFLYTLSTWGGDLEFSAGKFYTDGTEGIGGGFIGSIFGFLLIKAFGHTGLIIIALAILALYVSYFFSGSRGAAKKMLEALLTKGKAIIANAKELLKREKKEKPIKLTKSEKAKNEQLFADDYFAVDNGLSDLSISELGIHESRTKQTLEANPTLQEKVFHKSMTKDGKSARKFTADYGMSAEKGTAASKAYADNVIFADYSEPERKTAHHGVTLEENASDVFTKDFNPIDFAKSEKEASRPSSRAAFTTAAAPIIEERVSAITEEDVELARKKTDFDMKKRAYLEKLKAEREEKEAREEAERKAKEELERKAREEEERIARAAEARESGESFTQQRYRRAAEFVNGIYEEYDAKINPAPIEEKAPSTSESVYTFQKTESEVSKAPAFKEQPVFEIASEEPQEDGEKPFESAYEEDFTDEYIDESENDNEEFAEEYGIEPEQEEPQVREEIRISRTMLNPTPTLNLDFEGEEEEAEAEEPVNESEPSPEVLAYRKMFTMFEDDAKDKPKIQDDAPKYTYREEEFVPQKFEPKASEPEDEPPFDVDEPKKEEKKKKIDYSSYEFPPIDLLEKGTSSGDTGINEEMEENGQKIIETLSSFNVLASIKGYDRGPRITRYEVVPAKGVRVNQVVNLFDDIALNLAANGIRIEAPIPGKSAIGFEIPNKVPETVRLRDLLETERFREAQSKTIACIGKDVTGSPVFGDIAKMPHVLIAGATGMGKSVCINSILISILYKARPDEVKLILIDPKKVEFKMYNGIPHLLVPVVTDPKQAAGALMWAVEEMERRYDLIENQNVRNIDVYNDKMAKNPALGEPLPKIIIVIDELNDLMLQVRDPVEGLIMSIAQKARAAGIHLIIGTQRPSVNVITGVIKANIPSRMSCKVTSYQDSKTILEQAGAEKLLDKGDMLYFPSGNLKAERVQSAYVSDNEVYEIMDALRKNCGGATYDDKVMEDINRAAQKCVKRKESGMERDDDGGDQNSGAGYLNDQQFLSAVELATSSGKIATSLIQRRIGVGYGKAAKFIDIMEDMGIVGPPNGQKPREALITHDEWLEKLSRLEIN